jgi:hypothetical protein
MVLIVIAAGCMVPTRAAPSNHSAGTPGVLSSPVVVPTAKPASPAQPTSAILRRTIAGYVVGGGDTTPSGLYDVPRRFVYKVELEDRTFVDVMYTASPPSPSGDQGYRLNFYSGKISIGDYLKAQGRYDRDTNTLIVAEKGDYVETYPQKP